MGPVLLILALLFSLLIAAIAIANNDPVPVNYLLGTGKIPLIVLILGSAFIGAAVMGLFNLFRSIKSAFRFREARRRQDELKDKVRALEDEKNRLEAALDSLKAPAAVEADPGEDPATGGAGKPDDDPEAGEKNGGK